MSAKIVQLTDEQYYRKDDGRLTATMVKTAATSNLHAVYRYLRGEDLSSDAVRESWLCHIKALEPEVWQSKVKIPPPDLVEGITTVDGKEPKNPRATREYKERLFDWEARQSNSIVITDAEDRAVDEIVSAYMRSECFHMPTQTEVAIYYEIDGIPFKSKLDGIIEEDFWTDVIDLKFLRTTKGLASTVFRYGYHIQMALYLEAVRQVGMGSGSAIIVAVDKTTRHERDVVCTRVSPEALELGMEEARYWAKRIAECMQTGHWPGNEAPAELEVPSWYRPSFLFDQAVDQ